jgi:C4-dicarboxylate-specific signal transduction histidine kinase
MALAQSAKLITLGEMATGMAHELNQPLNVIKMAAQITQLELDEATASGGPEATLPASDLRRGLQQITKQVDRAASIIAHMRIFGRAPSGEAQVIDAVQVCRDAVGLVREQLRSSGIALIVEDPGEELLIRVHRILIEQVIVNLAMNARDAILGDGRSAGTVRVRPQRAADGKVAILVSDDGPGVPAALRNRLFEPFFTTKPVGKGVGLGLAISFGIVRDSGGRLSLTDDGPGATFCIELPRDG